MKPRIGWLLGDSNGVGPELSAKLLAKSDVVRKADIVIIGVPAVWEAGQRVAGVEVGVHRREDLSEISPADRPNFVSLHVLDAAEITPGQATRRAGEAVLATLGAGARALRDGKIDGLVFAPLNKQAMRLAGLAVEDELEYFAQQLDYRGLVCELNVLDGLWSSRVTSHIPLRRVVDEVTVDAVCNGAYVINGALQKSGVAHPRIVVCALNPHGGDGGTIGREEIDVIDPAIRRLQTEGIDARGPFPADTAFLVARKQICNAVLTRYHDQGQIALKTRGFERGVTVMGGLPVPITTAAQGTAFDIVGKGIADPRALRNAFDIVVEMATTRPAAL
ncbi:MAG: 4-hydroxythreonine-4-phosphate dehydrogenase PdxA [Terriglobales bacterium]